MFCGLCDNIRTRSDFTLAYTLKRPMGNLGRSVNLYTIFFIVSFTCYVKRNELVNIYFPYYMEVRLNQDQTAQQRLLKA